MVFVALGMKNEELVDGKREPNLMKNNPSNAVIWKLSRGEREIFNRDGEEAATLRKNASDWFTEKSTSRRKI